MVYSHEQLGACPHDGLGCGGLARGFPDLSLRDLRFPRQDDTAIDSWLKKWLEAGDEIPLPVIEICDRLLAADRATWMAEMELVAHVFASRQHKRRHGNSERQARWR